MNSRKIVETPEDSLSSSDAGEIDEKQESCDEARRPCDVGRREWFHIDHLNTGWIAKELQRFVRGPVLGLLYYSLLLGLVLLFDTLVDLQKTYLRIPAFILSSVLLAPLHMLCTHTLLVKDLPEKVCSGPHLEHIFKGKHLRTLAVPSLAYSGSQALVLVTPYVMAMLLPDPSLFDDKSLLLSILLLPTATVLAFSCVLVPAMVVLTRTEASLLFRDDGSIKTTAAGLPLPTTEKDHSEAEVRSRLIPIIRSVDFAMVQRSLKWSLIFISASVANIFVLVTF